MTQRGQRAGEGPENRWVYLKMVNPGCLTLQTPLQADFIGFPRWGQDVMGRILFTPLELG
jgi:hypothetical protein